MRRARTMVNVFWFIDDFTGINDGWGKGKNSEDIAKKILILSLSSIMGIKDILRDPFLIWESKSGTQV